ncbi:ketopantoate reductase family protein [Ascoidea rubescens DSM 1968]|uniref:6-phosphogluconate dehydrogenase C-terminal domain-like protein n=1 Tax=Ascoidea rubescens DSM 1968 TaxID=1344418 RepID=A0A1D2VN88_9ASCO|nr:6-phosphogluconate dehydrogenase C-terminal domain-like protein [Ascoidea rubescens DSM 1968]ODV63070.1 6-phosphogluconate dehydrogenase C-terminal domain-like protein [Ascoidea rubescens DSM 1968]
MTNTPINPLHQSDKPKILLIGLGGVGIIVALALETASKSNVTCLVRSNYHQITQHGYQINSINRGILHNWKPSNIINNINSAKDFGPFDYIIISTKNIPDSNSKSHDLLPFIDTNSSQNNSIINQNTTIILMQNGIDIEKPFFKKFPNNTILSVAALIGSVNNNSVVNHNGADRLIIGYFNNPNLSSDLQFQSAQRFINTYNCEQFPDNAVYDPDTRKTRWEKLLYNATFNVICSILNLDTTRCLISPSNTKLFEDGMNEICKIAKAENIDLNPRFKYQMIYNRLNYNYYTPSMLVDSRNNNLIEIEVILGNAIKIANSLNVNVPTLSVLYELGKMKQFRLKELNGLVQIDDSKPQESPLPPDF